MRQLRLRIRRHSTRVLLVQRGPNTLVGLAYNQWTGYGFSKWNYNDRGKPGLEYSKELGIIKATNKAIEDIVEQIGQSPVYSLPTQSDAVYLGPYTASSADWHGV